VKTSALEEEIATIRSKLMDTNCVVGFKGVKITEQNPTWCQSFNDSFIDVSSNFILTIIQLV
jgi:hypothetical protein